MGQKGSLMLFGALEKLNYLREINIESTDITDLDLIALKAVLQLNRSLKSLNISRNNLTSQGLSEFSNIYNLMRRLEVLNISYNDLRDIKNTGFFFNVLSLTNLKFLNLTCTRLAKTDISVFLYFEQMHNLEILSLSDNQIGNKGCRFIADMIHSLPNLTSLTLANNEITDKGVEYLLKKLADCRIPRSIDLGNNKITDNIIVAIKEYRSYIETLTCFNLRTQFSLRLNRKLSNSQISHILLQ